MEAKLKQSEQQFRLLVQGVTDYAIYMLNPIGRIASWNAGAQRIKGYSPEEIVGQHFSKFYMPEDQEAGEPERGLRIARDEGRTRHFSSKEREGGEQEQTKGVTE